MGSYELWQKIAGIGGLFYFLLLCLGAFAYTLWPSNKKDFDEAAKIPFTEE